MKDMTPEDILTIATLLSRQLAKTCSKQELISYKCFFQNVANNLQTIIFYELTK